MSGLFDWWIEDCQCNPGEATASFWKVQSFRFLTTLQVHLKNFATIALVLTTMPGSEAICERRFSKIKHIATDLNTTMNRNTSLS